MTQNNLGNALARLGERESGTGDLQQAVAAYQAALLERTRERVPLDWAATQTNLGLALVMLGERESGTGDLQQAVAAYRAALLEYTRERVPLDWAATQTGLGNVLGMLGGRDRDPEKFCDALQAHANAWQVFQQADPYAALMAANNAQKDFRAIKQQPPGPCATWLADNAEVLREMGVSTR